MTDLTSEISRVIFEVNKLLDDNPEWCNRYKKYAELILSNLETMKENKKKFNEWAPLHLYMNVTEAKGNLTFSLRYLGQDVAKLKVKDGRIIISTRNFDGNNFRDFGCNIELKDCEWRSKEAAEFRKWFSQKVERTNISGKRNEEHRMESLLLTEFAKKSSVGKSICNIQPVRLAGLARFQMPTPLNASDIKKLNYTGPRGGGIDILSRIGTGRSTKLCIMEVKDENILTEPPAKVIIQAMAYATFIRKLLRSSSGQLWWEIFGFKGNVPTNLDIYVACVMPTINCIDTGFGGKSVPYMNDRCHLHYVYFQEKDNELIITNTSLKECLK